MDQVIKETENGIYFLKLAQPDKGFYFNYILYIPNNIQNNTLIVEGSNIGNYNAKGILNDLNYIENGLKYSNFDTLEKLNAPMMMPLLIGRAEKDATNNPDYIERCQQQLSRNSVNPNLDDNRGVLTSDDFLYRSDKQVLEAIEDAKINVFEKTFVELENKSFLYGFSTSGIFASRLAFLYPEKFCGVWAGGINAIVPVPLNSYNGINLLYPVGTCDYETITGKKFDFEKYKELEQFYFWGENEDPKEYNIPVMRTYHDQDIASIYTQAFCEDMNERRNIINSIYNDLGFTDDRIVLLKKTGHTSEPLEDRCFEFISDCINSNGSRNMITSTSKTRK